MKPMQNTRQANEKKSYRVLLLLVVGLAAFSSAMKELNQVHELTLQTSQLLAQWSDVVMPGEKTVTLAKVETCENSKILLPPPPPPMPASELDEVSASAPAPPAPPAVREARVSKSKRVVQKDHDAAQVRVWISTDGEQIGNSVQVEKALKDAVEADVTWKSFKAKNRRHILIGPDGRDVILKSFNRTINLRSAS
jgi:hypothetical protein